MVIRMKFRPCIDIHNGKVKQIIGGSLEDRDNKARENFVAGNDAAYYASLYRKNRLKGGHIILLNQKESEYYEATKSQAIGALRAYPDGMQIGGGITDKNAEEFLKAGASHVIVTSFVFQNGDISFENLKKIVNITGKEHLVLDLSCKKKNGSYIIVTDRWQKDTEFILNHENLDRLSKYCDEFLIHAVDVEGKMQGIETELVELLGDWGMIPITYAGGIHDEADIDCIHAAGKGRLDYTIGSALDLFGGQMSFESIISCQRD